MSKLSVVIVMECSILSASPVNAVFRCWSYWFCVSLKLSITARLNKSYNDFLSIYPTEKTGSKLAFSFGKLTFLSVDWASLVETCVSLLSLWRKCWIWWTYCPHLSLKSSASRISSSNGFSFVISYAIVVWERDLVLADFDFQLLKSCNYCFTKSSAILNDRVCLIAVSGYYASMRCSTAFELLRVFCHANMTVDFSSVVLLFLFNHGDCWKFFLLKFLFCGGLEIRIMWWNAR